MPDSQPGDDRSEALARFLSGESSPEEQAALRTWLAEDPARESELRALDRQIRGLAFSPPADLDLDAAWRRTALRLGDANVRPLPGWHRSRPRLAALAAAIALVALGGFQLWRSLRSPETPSRVYSTPAGARDSIRFADGGRIVLAPASRLTAVHRPGSRPGEVRLEGEAYFEIPHDPARPFRVRTGDAEITDLGTVFTVQGRAGGTVWVQVMQGSVALRSRGTTDSIVLQPGDRGMLDTSGRISLIRGLPARGAPAWVDGRLEFEDAPLGEVRADLRRWYGVELLVLDSALLTRHITASFRGEPVSEVLDVIALALGATVTRRGDTALLQPTPGIR